MAVTREDVFAAANELQASGVKPTMALVRDKIGGGSLSIISPSLREWAHLHGGKNISVAIDMPTDVKAVIDKMAIELWRGLSAITDIKISRIETEATAAIAEATKDKDMALLEVEALEAHITELQACKAKLDLKVRAFEIQLEKQQNLLDVQETKILELKQEKMDAVLAEKVALDRASVLQGKMEFLLDNQKVKFVISDSFPPAASVVLEAEALSE